MKSRNVTGLFVLIFAMVMLSVAMPQAKAQQPIQTSTTAKYIKTAEDTLTYTSAAVRSGIITNQSADKNLIVYFSNKAGVKLTNSYVIIPAGKTFRFNALTYRIFRHASADSVFSQVILGEVQLNRIEKNEKGSGKPFVNENPYFMPSDQRYGKPIRYSYKFPM